jgi:hypothetical protein
MVKASNPSLRRPLLANITLIWKWLTATITLAYKLPMFLLQLNFVSGNATKLSADYCQKADELFS